MAWKRLNNYFHKYKQIFIALLKIFFLGRYHYTIKEYLIFLKYGINPGKINYYIENCNLSSCGNFTIVSIKNKQYFWPKEEGTDYLTWLYAETFNDSSTNYHAFEYSGAYISPGDIVCDLGACEGFFCQYALLKNANKVFAIEPTPQAVKALEKTFSLEIENNKLELIPCAAGSFSGEIYLNNKVGKIYDNFIENINKNNYNIEKNKMGGDK